MEEKQFAFRQDTADEWDKRGDGGICEKKGGKAGGFGCLRERICKRALKK